MSSTRSTTSTNAGGGGGGSGQCAVCIKALMWVPVIFIMMMVAWSYYAYVYELCLLIVNSNILKALYLIIYHVLFIMFLWAYLRSVFARIEPIPSKFYMSDEQIDRLFKCENEEQQRQILDEYAALLPNVTTTFNGCLRFCHKCRMIKPDRAHHCHVCGTCVLKMDHHCPWINNCVSFSNYKYFILFLAYALLYCLFVAATSLQYFVLFCRGELEGFVRFHILFLFFMALMFGMTLASLFGYHCYLVMNNRTTLEAFRAPIFRTYGVDKKGFDVGKYENFVQVFGPEPSMWFLPVFTSAGDGLVFTSNARHQTNVYDSMGTTQQSP